MFHFSDLHLHHTSELGISFSFFFIYDGSANFRDSPKVWKMKLRLWHVILHENGQCLLGTKKLEIMPNVGVEIFLSLPITFPDIVNVNPCQI